MFILLTSLAAPGLGLVGCSSGSEPDSRPVAAAPDDTSSTSLPTASDTSVPADAAGTGCALPLDQWCYFGYGTGPPCDAPTLDEVVAGVDEFELGGEVDRCLDPTADLELARAYNPFVGDEAWFDAGTLVAWRHWSDATGCAGDGHTFGEAPSCASFCVEYSWGYGYPVPWYGYAACPTSSTAP